MGKWNEHVRQNSGTPNLVQFQSCRTRSLAIISRREVVAMLPMLSSDFPSKLAHPQNEVVPSERIGALIRGSAHSTVFVRTGNHSASNGRGFDVSKNPQFAYELV